MARIASSLRQAPRSSQARLKHSHWVRLGGSQELDKGSDAAVWESRIRVWLWPNILSFDAPIVAVLWQVMFANSLGVPVNLAALALLGFGVWLVYIADGILDGLGNLHSLPVETARHRFYRVNRRAILPWMIPVFAGTVWLSVTKLDPPLFRAYSILAVPVCIYFAIVHVSPRYVQSHWPKELAVALLFASGVCLPVLIRLKSQDSMLIPFGAYIAILWINAVGIQCWEANLHPPARYCLKPKITQLIAIHLRDTAITIVAASGLLAFYLGPSERPLCGAVAISSLSLGVLDLVQDRLARDALRVLADVALLTPILSFAFLLT
jgi:hypothetical protein